MVVEKQTKKHSYRIKKEGPLYIYLSLYLYTIHP